MLDSRMAMVARFQKVEHPNPDEGKGHADIFARRTFGSKLKKYFRAKVRTKKTTVMSQEVPQYLKL